MTDLNNSKAKILELYLPMDKVVLVSCETYNKNTLNNGIDDNATFIFLICRQNEPTTRLLVKIPECYWLTLIK